MEQASETSVLPHSHVLSYVATADSPTRVRHLAALAVFVLATIHAVAGVILLTILALNILSIVQMYSSSPVADALVEAVTRSAGWILLIVYVITAAAVCFACSKPIGRGRKIACYLGMLPIVPLILALLGVSTVCGLAIVVTVSEGARLWAIPIFLVLGMALTVPTLLLCDLCGFLFWIGKNPITDKPPVPFIPK